MLDIAGGRVWSGSDALGIGLIDAYGGLKTAIALAVDKAGLGENFRVVEVTQQPSGLAAMLSTLNVSVRKAFVRSELQELFGGYDRVQRLLRMQGVLMYSPYEVELR